MGSISDKTILDAIRTVIRADTDITDTSGSDESKLHEIYREVIPNRPFSNYAEIIAPLPGSASLLPEEGQGGGAELTVRIYEIVCTFKKLVSGDDEDLGNDRLYDLVKNFRDNIGADRTLGSISGVDDTEVVDWGYAINVGDQNLKDLVNISLAISVTDTPGV